MPACTKISGAWKTVGSEYDCYVKVSGSWKKCDQVYVKVNGTWKPCYSKAPPPPQTQYNNMGLGTLPYATFDENYYRYITPNWRTVSLSNIQVGSTITLTGNARTLWRSGGSDGGADEGNYVGFELDCGLNGAYFSYGSVNDGRWNLFESGRSNYVNGIVLVTAYDDYFGGYGHISITFTATSSNVSITFAPIIAYTTLV